MLWVATWMVASVTSALPTASTYDQAACAESLSAELQPAAPALDADDPRDCRPQAAQPIPTVPTVIDCNDPGMSHWVADMIGSCDMPRPAPPTAGAPAAVKGARDGIARVTTGLRGADDLPPVRAPSRAANDDVPALSAFTALRYVPISTALCPALLPPATRLHESRLERPPRAV